MLACLHCHGEHEPLQSEPDCLPSDFHACIQGTVVYLIMIALGEMTTLFPNNGGFTGAATRFLDPAFGFAIGWVRVFPGWRL